MKLELYGSCVLKSALRMCHEIGYFQPIVWTECLMRSYGVRVGARSTKEFSVQVSRKETFRGPFIAQK